MKFLSRPMQITLVIVVALILWMLWGLWMTKGIEEPAFTLVSKENHTSLPAHVELREYEPMIIAATTINGRYKKSMNSGFMVIADYIFGNNAGDEKIAMTAPVVEKKNTGEKIAMTAPVVEQTDDAGMRTMYFVLPSKYSMETLPKPNNPKVILQEIPAHTVAALRFSGWLNETKSAQRKGELEQVLAAAGIKTTSEMRTAQYNPPWTLGWMRRNEILVDVSL